MSVFCHRLPLKSWLSFLQIFSYKEMSPKKVWQSSTPLAVDEMTGPSSPRATRWETVGFQEAADKGQGMLRRGFSQPWKHSPPGLGFSSAEHVFWGAGVHGVSTVTPLGRKTREYNTLLDMGHLRHLFCPCVYLMQMVKHAMIVFPSTPRKIEICFFFKREDFYSKTKSYHVAQTSLNLAVILLPPKN